MKQRLFAGLGAVILICTTVILAPLYGFFAEGVPAMRGPFGWLEVPTVAPYQKGITSPEVLDIAEQARNLLEAHRAKLSAPALSAAVAMNGEIVWSGASGWANIEQDLVATPKTLFRIGSTSKPVTGTLLARFVDSKLVDLDTEIAHYLPDLPNENWGKITLRQLASHSAGLPEYETNRDWLGAYESMVLDQAHTNVSQSLANFDDMPLRHPPGTHFEYSSFGTTLIAALLQEVGHKPFQTLIREWVTSPLNINSPTPDRSQPLRAQFYQLDGTKVKPWRTVNLSNKLAGGGFMATPEDLVILGLGWLDKSFISEQTRTEFWTPQRLADNKINEQNYALTWRWSEDSKMANHGGVSKGSMAWLAVYPDKQLAIALTMNTKVDNFFDFAGLQNQLVDIFSANNTSANTNPTD